MFSENSSQPVPGVIVTDRFGPRSTCYSCGAFASVSRSDGLIRPHDKPRGAGTCRVKWAVADLDTAISRDEKLNEEEKRVRDSVWSWVKMSCKGPKVDSECHHPACHRKVERGMRWTLSGWARD